MDAIKGEKVEKSSTPSSTGTTRRTSATQTSRRTSTSRFSWSAPGPAGPTFGALACRGPGHFLRSRSTVDVGSQGACHQRIALTRDDQTVWVRQVLARTDQAIVGVRRLGTGGERSLVLYKTHSPDGPPEHPHTDTS